MAKIIRRSPPQWIMGRDGRRKQLEKSRWNQERVAEIFVEEPNKEFGLNEIARLVYGTNTKTNRDKVRKHIPPQRQYMMARLKPIVTTYGPRGTIEKVKFYDRTSSEDRSHMSIELERLRARKELTDERYQQLCQVFGLTAIEEKAE